MLLEILVQREPMRVIAHPVAYSDQRFATCETWTFLKFHMLQEKRRGGVVIHNPNASLSFHGYERCTCQSTSIRSSCRPHSRTPPISRTPCGRTPLAAHQLTNAC